MKTYCVIQSVLKSRHKEGITHAREFSGALFERDNGERRSEEPSDSNMDLNLVKERLKECCMDVF